MAAPIHQTGRKTIAAIAVPEAPPKTRPARAQMPSSAKPAAMTTNVCMSNPDPLLRLTDVEPFDLACRGEMKSEVCSKVTPWLRVKCANQIEPVVLNAFNRGEALVAECVLSKLLKAARAAVVIELGIGLEECRPSFSITLLQRLDSRSYGWVRERGGDHCGLSPFRSGIVERS